MAEIGQDDSLDDGAGEVHRRQPSSAAIAALERGNKIEAIKITRLDFNLDLKAAKDLIDRYIATHSALQERFKSTGSGALGWIFMMILVIAAIAYFFPRGS